MAWSTVDVRRLADPAATTALGTWLGRGLADAAAARGPGALLVALHGPLGAGKTTLTRGLLRAFGHQGAVRSPTYTLVEPYELGARSVHHLDLYRVADPDELEHLGLRDLLGEPAAVCVVEWAERGEGWLPAADIEVTLAIDGEGRRATVRAGSPRGAAVLAAADRGPEAGA